MDDTSKRFRLLLRIAGTAAPVWALNGLINYNLMQPPAGVPAQLFSFRYRLDEAAFILLFLFLCVLFLGMYAVLPREKGYLYLALLSLLASLQLFSEWNEKSLIFGPFPEVPADSLAIKCGMAFLVFLFVSYLLRTGGRRLNKVILGLSGLMFAAALAVSLSGAGEAVLELLNRLFLLLVVANMSISAGQFALLLHKRENREELRWIAYGFVLFIVILFPDIGKDVLEAVLNRPLGYRRVYWEQCLEDTFPWALLVLLGVFGILFFRRFTFTLEENRRVTEQQRLQNKVLRQEIHVRERMDQLLTAFTRVSRLSDLEHIVRREGEELFRPRLFRLVKLEGVEGPLQAPGELQAEPGRILCGAGRFAGSAYYLEVAAGDGEPLVLEERERFALQLLSKYTALFHEYFRLIETRLQEVEAGRMEPWVNKLFMQIAEKERKRLASDLHDEALQELMHIRRLLEAGINGEPNALESKLEQVRLGLDNAEFMLRETCQELMPSFLSERGVLKAVDRLVEKTKLRADFRLDYRPLKAPVSSADEQSLAVYRIVQELINNAVKHSEAKRVVMEVGQVGGTWVIRYDDDGRGMDLPEGLPSEGKLGLLGLTERVRMMGGTVHLESEPGWGFKAECRIPL